MEQETEIVGIDEVTAQYLIDAISTENYSPEMVTAIAELYKALTN